ncbi:MAG: class A beta-lactamase [Candidatus Tumulicola sp.]
MTLRRNQFLAGAAGIAAAGAGLRMAEASGDPLRELSQLETDTGGRLGVCAFDAGSGRTIRYRAGERFAMCSTFKLPAVAAVLAQVDLGIDSLDRRVRYGTSDLLAYAPETRKHLHGGSMTLAALCGAAIEYSDNTAANLLLRTLGGPAGVTRYVRTLGDSVTNLNRSEPALNSAIPGDPRDTTAPAAMLMDMRLLLLGTSLSAGSRTRLVGWLKNCRTGMDCLRAGIPPSWTAGDKTGSGGAVNAAGASSTRNDVAIVWPPKRSPLLVTAYLTQSKLSAAQSDAALVTVARIVTRALSI